MSNTGISNCPGRLLDQKRSISDVKLVRRVERSSKEINNETTHLIIYFFTCINSPKMQYLIETILTSRNSFVNKHLKHLFTR